MHVNTLFACARTHTIPTMLSTDQILEEAARDGSIDMYVSLILSQLPLD